jgi:hypothetical protein
MKISNFIICDDIRFEKDNKISLMGLYEEVISFNVDPSNKGKWPKLFSFAILLRMQIEDKDVESGTMALGVSIEVNGEEQLVTKIDIKSEHLQNRKKIGIMPKINNFPIKSEGNLIVKVSLFDKDGKEVDQVVSPTTKIVESVRDTL